MAVYFDHNATTPVHPRVREAMEPYFHEEFGNASCLYRLGINASYAVEKARLQTARLLNAREEEIIFTSGGTEADNLAIKGVVMASGKRHIVTSVIEHPAVLQTCAFLEHYWDCRVTYLPVDAYGRVDPADLEKAITSETALVTIMAANNETGSIQPVRELADICRQRGILFHTDAVQAVGKIPVDVQGLRVDLLSLSGHKMYGPKGVGALYVRKGVELVPQAHGGGHEGGRRSGTENVPGIAGLGMAAELSRNELNSRIRHAAALRDGLWERLQRLNLNLVRNSPDGNCLPGTLNFSLPGINSRELVRQLDEAGFCVATGSACSTGKTTPSHVIKAIGRSDAAAASSIRISLGEGNTEAEIAAFVEVLPRAVEQAWAVSRASSGREGR
ncbi:MAG: cysteine desulfurase [Candidatus Omnitrophica bacterium]|nr:cysteine desulfurase [Candidatus Omnitrophota bacterium]